MFGALCVELNTSFDTSGIGILQKKDKRVFLQKKRLKKRGVPHFFLRTRGSQIWKASSRFWLSVIFS
jgi:hypothetical protein